MKKITLLVCFILLLSGCYDYRELNDMSIVSGIGIDYVDSEYHVSLEITNSSKDGSSTEIETVIVTGKDSNISEAFNKAKNMSDKDVYLEHIELLVVGESLAKKGLNDCLDYIIRDTKINNNYFVVVSNDPNKLLSTDEENKRMSEVIVNTIKYTYGNSNIDDLDILVSKFISDKEDIALPYVSLNDKNIEYKEIVYFNRDKMVGKMDYKMYSFLVLDTSNVLFSSLGNTINVYKKNIDIKVVDNKFVINIDVNGQIKEISKNIDLKDEDSYSKLESLINERIEEEVKTFIDTIIERDSDLLGFKDIYYKEYKRNINSFKYDINVNTIINKNGTIYEVLDDK